MEGFICTPVQLHTSILLSFFGARHNNKNFMIWLFCVIAFHNESDIPEENAFHIPPDEKTTFRSLLRWAGSISPQMEIFSEKVFAALMANFKFSLLFGD